MRKTIAARREELMAAAAGLFAARGYEGTSVADIAKAAGTYPAVFYRCYENKAELYDELVRQQASAIWRSVLDEVQTKDPLLAIETLVRAWFKAMASNEFICALHAHSGGPENAERRARPFVIGIKGIVEVADSLCRQAEQDPELQGYPDPMSQLGVVIATVIGWCAWQGELSQWFSADAVADSLAEMVRARVELFRLRGKARPSDATNNDATEDATRCAG